MLKRILSILVIFALCLAYVPAQVFAVNGTASSTSDFWAFAGDDELTLMADITDTGYVMDLAGVTSNAFTISLNGNTLEIGSITGLNGGRVTFDGPGTVSVSEFRASSGVLDLTNSAVFEVRNDGDVVSESGGNLSIDLTGGATLIAGQVGSSEGEVYLNGSNLEVNTLHLYDGACTLINGSTLTANYATIEGTLTLSNTSAATINNYSTDDGSIVLEGGSSLTCNDVHHYGSTTTGSGALSMNDASTMTVNDAFEWVSNDTMNIVESSELHLKGEVILDYFDTANPGDAAPTLDSLSPAQILIDHADQIWCYEASHAANVVNHFFYKDYMAHFEAHYTDGSSKISITNILPNEETVESYSGTIALRGSGYAEASVTTAPTAKTGLVYNGSAQELFNAGASDTGTVWYGLDDLDPTNWSADIPTATDAATYDFACYTVAGDYAHYHGVVVNVSNVMISPYTTAVTVNIKGNTETYIYDGYEHIVDGFTIESISPSDAPFAETDIAVTGVAYASGTDADTYDMVMPTFENGKAASVPNVTFNVTEGYVTIEPREVTLTSGSASKKRDGTPLTEETVTVGGDGWAPGEGATYSNFASITDVGSTDNTFNYTLNAGMLDGNYNITQEYGTLTIESSGGGGGGGGGSDPAEEPAPEEESYDFTQPEEGVGSGVEDEEAWTWGERANLAEDTATLYMILSNNSVSEEEDAELPYPEIGTEHFLTKEEVWVLPDTDHEKKTHTVDTVLVCQEDEPLYVANGDGKVEEASFGNSEFYVVSVGTGDTRIDYPNLITGDVVKSTTFNGIYITKVPKTGNPNFDSDLIRVKEDVVASFRSFEFDHPEVFWLTDSVRVRAVTVSVNGVQTAYLFIVLVDNSGFCMRMDEYAAPGAIEAAIKQRDAAADAIIAQIPKNASTREVIANLNKWFTLHNEYNRTPDLNTIGFAPHRSLRALVGGEGLNGPVCDGYSRAFKMICDRIGIPVILDTGVASIGAHSEYHMWMRIQVDGVWYGMDCTWNDPVVEGVNGIISGFENEKYMLVGDDTVVDGKKFGVTHPSNKAVGGTTGVLFASLMVNVDEIEGYVAMPFEDVRLSDWYYDYVKSAFGKQLMGGTSSGIFSPQGTATRGQIVQILYNAAGQPAVDEVKVEGWFGKAATWAMEQGIVAGYADGEFHGEDTVTREQLATILWAYEGAPQAGGELAFADAAKVSGWAKTAMQWAKDEGIIGGKPGNLADPQGTATRAEIATIFSNYMK